MRSITNFCIHIVCNRGKYLNTYCFYIYREYLISKIHFENQNDLYVIWGKKGDHMVECFSTTIVREADEKILRIDCSECTFFPSVEDNPLVMSKTVDLLISNTGVTKIVFYQQRDYEYDFQQVQLLQEVANLFKWIVSKEGLIRYHTYFINPNSKNVGTKWAEVQNIIYRMIRRHPVGAYIYTKRMLRKEQAILDGIVDDTFIFQQKLVSVIEQLLEKLSSLRIVILAQSKISGAEVEDRDVYATIFTPVMKPDFMFTKLMARYPEGGEVIDNYYVGDTEITIFKFKDSVQYLYHVIPPEFKLTEDKYEVLDTARKVMAEHKPKKEEFVDPERMREVFQNIGRDLLEDIIKQKNLNLSLDEIELLSKILVRYTVGFGLIEILLEDEKIQDISVNSPLGHIPIFIVHADYADCKTNILPMMTESESWATKLRLISGRPLDEANQILDTEIKLPVATARVSVVTAPFNPTGLAYSFRRHRDRPWTLALFCKLGMINSLAAGLISFLIDGTRAILVAGTRSSGKSSLLGSFLVEIMRRYRIITIEDTLELPTDSLRKLDFNIQSLKVSSALSVGGNEVDSSTGIRSTLRLGDSALFVGEVRSKEAIALYEAMRVGAAANVVAGTIHGAGPYSVYDRVVNDIGVPKTSFKATDIIISVNPIRDPSGIGRVRRVLGITEVRKEWEEDPLEEGGFVDLMKYNVETDQLEPTAELLNGNSDILKAIAGNIKDMSGDWDAVWNNILLRAKIKERLVEIATQEKNMELLEAPFVIKTNDIFHNVIDKFQTKEGLDNDKIYFEWNELVMKEVKRIKYG